MPSRGHRVVMLRVAVGFGKGAQECLSLVLSWPYFSLVRPSREIHAQGSLPSGLAP